LQVVLSRPAYITPFEFFQNSVPLKSSGNVDSANVFHRALSVLSLAENTPKYLIVFGDYAKSLQGLTEIEAIL
jgi:hypothetical protein